MLLFVLTLSRSATQKAWGDSGGFSTNSVSGDGAISFKCRSTNGYAMIGFSVGDRYENTGPNWKHNYGSIDCACYCSNGNIGWYERGSAKQLGQNNKYTGTRSGTVSMSADVFVMQRRGDTVTLWRNGNLERTCGRQMPIGEKVSVDASIYSSDAGFEQVEWRPDLAKAPLPDAGAKTKEDQPSSVISMNGTVEATAVISDGAQVYKDPCCSRFSLCKSLQFIP